MEQENMKDASEDRLQIVCNIRSTTLNHDY